MNVLITGGSGLIAGRLCEYIKKIHNVTIVSRSKVNPIENVKTLVTNKIDSSILSSQDIIVHTAGPNHHHCEDVIIREKYLKETKILIDNASRSGIKKFIFTSSTRVYGKFPTGNIDEESDTLIEDNYSLVKKEIEDYLEQVPSNLERYSLRISNSYGYPTIKEAECWSLVIMYACKQAFIDNKVALRSNGEEYKDFIPIMSVVEAINNLIMIKGNQTHKVYNVTSGNTEKVKNILNYLIDMINTLNKKQVKLILSNNQKTYPKYQIHSDLKSINCNPVVNHTKEMEILIKYCQKNYNRENI